jgi:hypothetical protein
VIFLRRRETVRHPVGKVGQEYTLPKMEIIDGNVACFDETGTISEKKNF